ncbi:MAG: TIGR03790 family protein [Planctomycetota bacterium]
MALPPVLCSALLAPLASPSCPGGSGESAVLVVDPANAESMYVANTYMERRDVPAANAVYLRPIAANYATFVAENLAGFQGALNNRRIRDHVDYVVLPPGDDFFVPASGFVSDTCAPVNRFASASVYTLAGVTNLVLGGTSSGFPNQYQAESWDARFFDASYPWLGGQPSAGGTQYFIGAMLGYTGPNGNSLQEVLDLIDRSAAADATMPAGTFYYVETTDAARSAPRDFAYPEAVAQMAAVGGVAEHIFAVLPIGEHDCLGVMTGWATPDVEGGDFTLLPGSFGDHLTSFAGKFDTTSQTKMSEWIRKGASGTSGAVEEPCNYSGKFPHARMHVLYRQGMTLGESWLRSMGFLPFQNLLYGDPLTAPWAQPPAVDVPDLPASAVAGTIAIAAVAAATAPGAGIHATELLIDGVMIERLDGVGAFALDTTQLADGWHDLRVLAYDTSAARHTGRFRSSLLVDNAGLSVALTPGATAGDLGTRFELGVAAAGGAVEELRLLQNGRVVAAGGAGTTALAAHGHNLGAGPVRLQAEALFAGGGRARSAPVELDIAYAGGGAGAAPQASSYSKRAQQDVACVVELPAAYPDDPADAVYALVQAPAQATLTSFAGGPYAVLTPNAGAVGLDSLVFEVTTPSGTSAQATVVIEYVPGVDFPPADFFGLAGAVPAQVPALAPGSAQSVELVGTGFGPGTVVELDGQPLDGLLPKPYTFASPTSLTIDLPQVDQLGAVDVTVRDGVHAASTSLEIVANQAPALQLASGDPGDLVFQFQGVDVVLAGTPGSTHVLVGSVFDAPSELPGVVQLELGAGFSFVPVLGVHTIDAVQGWTEVHLPLANIPPATTVYAQSVELTPLPPYPASNLQEIFVAF